MSKVAELACDMCRYDELYDFAENCGVDTDEFDAIFWDVVMSETDYDRGYWIIWNWIDCEGEESIDSLYAQYYLWFGDTK